MRITIESTSRIVNVNGHEARVWEGTTDSGIPVVALIPRIAVRDTNNKHDQVEFERELERCAMPSPAAQAAYPTRMVL